MLEGAFVSLSVGFVAVGLAVFIGIVAGGLAGYYGPRRLGIGPVRLLRVDTLVTALIDVMLSFPTFFLILTVVAILRPSIWNIMVVIGLTSWEGPARLVRAEILSLREREFVHAAQAAGAPGRRMIGRHLLPNAVGPVLVSATLGVAGAILIESSLSFLGFGVPPPSATWGNILADGKRFIFDAPWLTLVPGTAILVVVLAFNLFGEGLREAFNPRLREG
jgi:peptide/nickel transport system permease protein